jgi:ATP-dependent exoDNAse (exonuclease V) beta subunit
VVFIERTNAKKYAGLRPDLIVKSSEGVLVVDYKTGAEKSKDQEQIRSYVSALGNVFAKISESIIYL